MTPQQVKPEFDKNTKTVVPGFWLNYYDIFANGLMLVPNKYSC